MQYGIAFTPLVPSVVLWLAVAAIGRDARSGEKGAATDSVPVRMRVLEMQGLGWRAENFPSLELVGRSGTTMVWATDAATVGRLQGTAVSEKSIATGVTDTAFASLSHEDLLRWLEGRPAVARGLLLQRSKSWPAARHR